MTIVTTTTPADLLDAAADHIERYGWVQEDFIKFTWVEEGEHHLPSSQCAACAMGALNLAAGVSPDLDLDGDRAIAAYALVDHLATPDDTEIIDVGELAQWITEWNDAEGRTREQVIAELRATAAELRKGDPA